LVLGLCLVLGGAPAAAFDLNLTAGLDFDGEIGDEVTVDADTGYSLGLELAFDAPIVELGVGVEYGFGRGTDASDEDLDYRQLYAFARLGILGPVYATARAGYADLSGLTALDGGETWSVGGGVSLLDKVKVEVLLNNFSGEVEGLDVDYETYSARLVYTF
jgi:hypothetical protein